MDKQIAQTENRRRRAAGGSFHRDGQPALASPDQVKAETREAVMKAVRETGYVLNLAARNLRTSRTHAVLAVLPDVSNIFFSQVLRGISDTLHRHGYSLSSPTPPTIPSASATMPVSSRAGASTACCCSMAALLPSPAARRGQRCPPSACASAFPAPTAPCGDGQSRGRARHDGAT